jgi:nucleoside-diphosphate-sugar epimerase
VDDVIDALLLAAFRNGVEGRVYHIVDTTPVTQEQYLAAWQQRVTDIPLRRIPLAAALALAALMEFPARLLGRDAPLTRYRIRSLRPLSGFDTSCARDVLGWLPRVGIRRGLQLCFGT